MYFLIKQCLMQKKYTSYNYLINDIFSNLINAEMTFSVQSVVHRAQEMVFFYT